MDLALFPDGPSIGRALILVKLIDFTNEGPNINDTVGVSEV